MGVHECLERSRRVGEAEGHDEELEQALMGAEGGHLHVVGVHQYLVIAVAQIELGEEGGAAEFIEEFLHYGNRELDFDGLCV
jgi:hypothetical protein